MFIGIIAANNIRYSPYIFYYANILDACGIDYELIFADQERVKDSFDQKSYAVKWNPKIPRAIEYFFYSRKVISIIKKKHYDGLIVLTSITAVYCSTFLKRYYSQRYIVDIRDYTHENIKPYYILEKMGILNSAITVISSPQFVNFLPRYDYMVCHNINFNVDKKCRVWKRPNPNKIVIGYIGAVGYKQNCISLMKMVQNDSRFELRIYGFEPGEPDVQNLVKEMKNERITYYGPYKPAEKEDIVNSVDILFNTYGNGCPLLDYALSNKLYDALYLKKLLLTSPNTAMEKMGGEIAYSIDYTITDTLNGLYDWVMGLDEEKVQFFQEQRFNEFLAENKITKERIISIITSWK